MNFVKMQGAGNDYIYFDCIRSPFECNPQKVSVVLSDRHFGIGGDGIVLIMKSDVADFRMRIFNADGSEGKMCGNASRCVGKYLFENRYTDKKEISLETASGIKKLLINENAEGSICVTTEMGRISFKHEDVPVILPDGAQSLEVSGTKALCLSVGNPHCVIFTDDICDYPLEETAQKLTLSGIFPEGVNLETARITDGLIEARVFERGSGETLACGTGACAVAAAALKLGLIKDRNGIPVRMPGGLLKISIKDDWTVLLSGPAETVFEGNVNLNSI